MYEYFRTLFVGEFESKTGEWIAFEKKMKHLDSVMQVPVLMSLLIVCMDVRGATVPMVPATIADLYQIAMTKLYQERCGDNWRQMQRLVRAIFTQNQLRRRRQFGYMDVVSALQEETNCSTRETYTWALSSACAAIFWHVST